MNVHRVVCLGLAALCVAPSMSFPSQDAGRDATKADKDARPTLVLRASPSVSFSPATITLRAELRGGRDDFEPYYCAGIEWEWGDETKSENAYDCEPFEEGKSEIRRVFAVQHTYNQPGTYRVYFRLKQQSKVVASASAQLQIRPGLRDGLP